MTKRKFKSYDIGKRKITSMRYRQTKNHIDTIWVNVKNTSIRYRQKKNNIDMISITEKPHRHDIGKQKNIYRYDIDK